MQRESGLLHPLALIAIAVLILNDHVLKDAWPGTVTGRLSDFAGLAFFPLLLGVVVRRAAILATGAGFAAVKLWQPANALCEHALGLLQWPFRAVASGELVAVERVSIVRDPTDLVALVALVIPWAILKSRRAARVSIA